MAGLTKSYDVMNTILTLWMERREKMQMRQGSIVLASEEIKDEHNNESSWNVQTKKNITSISPL